MREGSQHCQCGTPEFLAESISAAKKMTDKPLLFRMDSGNDAFEKMLFLPDTEINMYWTSLVVSDEPVRHNTIKRRRIRTIIDNLILIAGHLTVHARKLRLALGRSNGWIHTFLRLATAF